MSHDTPDAEGDCFPVAAHLTIEMAEKFPAAEITLVHGIVSGQGPVAGARFMHAWVEMGDVVFDQSNGNNIVLRREQYYEIGEITDTRRYTAAQSLCMRIRNEHYGPWHDC